jgi:hypothetical protein
MAYATRIVLLLIALALTLAGALPVMAQPFVGADAYKVDGLDPDSCSCAATGGPVAAPALACALAPVTGGEQPKCNMAPITTPGTYQVTITITRNEKITNSPGAGTFVPAGSATSAPFAYTLGAGAIALPLNARLLAQ